MIRTIIALLVIALVAAVALAAAGDAGSASLVWLGWRIDTSASVVLVAVALGALAATLFWRTVLWFLAAPARAARARAEARRREGAESLARGFVAVAAGAGSDARRLAQKAADYIDDQPVLVRILAATAAEAAGDEAAAHAAYTAMLGFPELRLAGRRGLMLLAQRKGDAADAVRHAEAAYNLTKTARWAWRALLEARLAAGDWDAALTLAKDALDRKIVSPVSAERTRAALLAASAARREMSADPKALEEALDLASQAAKLRPDFTPGVLTAARRLAADGRGSRAAQLIEAAWKVRPHPGLAIAYRDLVTSETPRERARRLAGLADILPTHHESRILMIEQALRRSTGLTPAPACAGSWRGSHLPRMSPTKRGAGLRAPPSRRSSRTGAILTQRAVSSPMVPRTGVAWCRTTLKPASSFIRGSSAESGS